MSENLIRFSIDNKLLMLLFVSGIVGFGLYALANIPIGAVPDVTNNQVQVITTSRNLATQDMEQFITYPIELEMANLPGVKEIRSVSKFGLSVVTIVFEDELGTYLPRQLIAEKIKSAEERIPDGFGKPFMGPVSTGLGEIYQYILDVRPGYEDRYSIIELRTMQDWLVKRQLSGIAGVVEVNTWGGFFFLFEVSVDPSQLRAMDVAITDVFTALEDNNSITGGSYIEKTNQSYFIRGEGLLGSQEDIENVIVANREGLPIYIKDIATVQDGAANRFGAITANGQGEKVMGQVMMLKDANSKAVIERVKERVELVQKSLPEGVFINGFLERSELIGRTTATISENLILGFLIVLFVVIVLLGNLRSGLVVASVIPLCLLFALSLMYLFGVDANLMSLGAIDFGIIIDGAVIIVEYIAFQITANSSELLGVKKHKRQQLLDEITLTSTTKMMRSAVFGQLIIIIVFIPVLSLAGVEGKMFRPMALTFCFALLGAVVLCFTYVPVMAALFLKPAPNSKRNIAARLMHGLETIYTPIIRFALRFKVLVLGLATLFLVAGGLLFSQLGGEFVPTLDEGDFVIQPVLKTGTSLSKTIETMTKIEKILLTFPEVDQVVSRIGAAEVPTDPMAMEETDVIIKLIPRKEWTSASSKDALADEFKTALSEIPGLEYEFTQPIEMRFNELITGVRADLAIKIFGEDLAVLNRKATEIKKAIEKVAGAADISVEKVAGLPQMSIKYQRAKIARYGLNVTDVNRVLTMSFAGMTAGSVFEGEKQFDLVVKYAADFRTDLADIRNTSVQLPNRGTVPLSELATIEYTTGPAQISRDDTQRRIVVGVNVRNRDLESVVADVQAIIEQDIAIPTGYSIRYGGQFENLRTATNRLKVAVPIALLLIFVLLYFAFHSVKEALIVFSAIPLAAVGGILLLHLRGLPFSISAGVGFIALFGIAVLNGIVLIEHFKEMKKHGFTDLNERIITGTRQRLRPVLLTATAAALGFLPMALSTSAGAEVQRPLATVVIGGLFTATLLTLVVLPILYALSERRSKIPPAPTLPTIILLVVTLFATTAPAQETGLTLTAAQKMALKNSSLLDLNRLAIQQSQSAVGKAYNIDKTAFYYSFDRNNIAENGQALHVLGAQQNFQLPRVYRQQKAVNESQVIVQQQRLKQEERQLKQTIAQAYDAVLYRQQVTENYQYLDSLYAQFAQAATRRYETGETAYLEQLTAVTKQKEVAMQLRQSKQELMVAQQELARWLQIDDLPILPTDTFVRRLIDTLILIEQPTLLYYQATTQVAQNQAALAKLQGLPDIQLEYFMGSNFANNARFYPGFQLGVGVPLWRKAERAAIEVAELESRIIDRQVQQFKLRLRAQQRQLLTQLTKYEEALLFYETEGRKLAKELLNYGTKAFLAGEINFFQYLQSLENAKVLEKNYLDNLYQYNQTVLELNYLQ
ncbi:MAG: CusA/CzcA family heavy metal efflux RND transporter [Saprospiraceae bacterium]